MPISLGDTISVHYRGTFDDGAEFDRSAPGCPLRFKVGAGQVIRGFDKAVLGHESGDSFTVRIPPEEAYGLRQERLVFPVPLAKVPANIQPELGMRLHVRTDQGELEVRVSKIGDTHMELDANHPLAGQALTFELRIADIEGDKA